MRELYKVGFFVLTLQNGIPFTCQQTVDSQFSSDNSQGKNFLVHTFEAVTNGMYWMTVVTILVYFFYLFSSRQVEAYYESNRDTFQILELNPEQNNPTSYAEFTNSADSFSTVDFDDSTTSGTLVPTFTLSDEEMKHFRRPLREVWALSKDNKTRTSAMEILNREIQESRKLRQDLENSLEKILEENDHQLVNERKSSDRLRFDISSVDKAGLRERLSAFECEESLTKSALRDPKGIQHKLEASRSEISDLQRQIEELKIEKQTAIELVSKIIFRGNNRHRTQRPLRNDSSKDPLRNKSPQESFDRTPSSPNDSFRNHTQFKPSRIDSPRTCSFTGSGTQRSPSFQNGSSADRLLNYSLPGSLDRESSSRKGSFRNCFQSEPPRIDSLRTCSLAGSDPTGCYSSFRSDDHSDTEYTERSGQDRRSSFSGLVLAESSSCLNPLQECPGPQREDFPPHGLLNEEGLARMVAYYVFPVKPHNEDRNNLDNQECHEKNLTEEKSFQSCDQKDSSPRLSLCSDAEKEINFKMSGETGSKLQEPDQLSPPEISEDLSPDEIDKLSGPVTGSPQFQTFMNEFCKDAKPQ